jgi:hypothetical protein
MSRGPRTGPEIAGDRERPVLAGLVQLDTDRLLRALVQAIYSQME